MTEDAQECDSGHLRITWHWPVPFDTIQYKKGEYATTYVKGFFELCWESYRRKGLVR